MESNTMTNTELIEKCELEISGFQQRGVRCREYTELLSRFRTLSGQGKALPTVDEIMRVFNEFASGKYDVQYVRNALNQLHTAQPAPVSVEDVMNAVFFKSDQEVDYEIKIKPSQLRTTLNNLLNKDK